MNNAPGIFSFLASRRRKCKSLKGELFLQFAGAEHFRPFCLGVGQAAFAQDLKRHHLAVLKTIEITKVKFRDLALTQMEKAVLAVRLGIARFLRCASLFRE